jgi:hypothetical protein
VEGNEGSGNQQQTNRGELRVYMHGYNPSYFARFNIPHDPPASAGISYPESIFHYRDHIFHNCDGYAEHRHILTAIHREHSPAILLSGTKGLLATCEPPCPPELPGLDLPDPAETDLLVDVPDPP